MIWNRPKQLINRLGLLTSLISLIMALFWLYLFYVWCLKPEKISEYDINTPDHYENHLIRLETRIDKAKDDSQKLERLLELVDTLKHTTSLHKSYSLVEKSNKQLIEFYIETGQFDKALDVAKNWQINYPFDFNAKFIYAELLSEKSPDKALEYFQQIHNKNNDIYELNKRYVELLLATDNFDEAYKLAVDSKKRNRKRIQPHFVFYNTSEPKKAFKADSKNPVSGKEISINKDEFIIEKQLLINGVHRLRFDVDRIPTGSIIKDIDFEIETRNNSYSNIEIKPLHSLKIENSGFKVTDKDPYFEVFLPKDAVNSSEKLTIKVKLIIEKRHAYIMDLISEYPQFKQLHLESERRKQAEK